MNDYLRESFSYFGLMKKVRRAEKPFAPERVSYGADREQYFLYYEPVAPASGIVVAWIHGGGWNAGNPRLFDYVGQRFAMEGYRCLSLGYRLSPRNKWPAQIEDVCACYGAAMRFLEKKGVDASRVVVAGPSAGAHLASILCYSRAAREKYGADVSNVVGFIGSGGPYSFSVPVSLTLKLLLNQLFEKGCDRRNGEPVSLMSESAIPMLLIQSRHDGLIAYESAEAFAERARALGIPCELYSVVDEKNTHSWYTAGMFLERRDENRGLDKLLSWIEQRDAQ